MLQAEPSAATEKPESDFTDDEIRERAYYRWLARGEGHGDDQRDWFDAQIELRELRTLQAESAE